MKNKIIKKLFRWYIIKRIYNERLGEPIIYNLASIFVFLFGNFRSKVKYDLVPREAYAYGILAAADYATENNIKKNCNNRIWSSRWEWVIKYVLHSR
jgi:hypothetical protein